MDHRSRGASLANVLSVSRVALALPFACVAFFPLPATAIGAVYGAAANTDLVDERLARRFRAESYVGQVLGLVGDKSLTIVSVLYAAACDLPLAPLAAIATREVVVIGLRLVVIGQTPLLATNRVFGGVMASAIPGTTLYLILSPSDSGSSAMASVVVTISPSGEVMSVTPVIAPIGFVASDQATSRACAVRSLGAREFASHLWPWRPAGQLAAQ